MSMEIDSDGNLYIMRRPSDNYSVLYHLLVMVSVVLSSDSDTVNAFTVLTDVVIEICDQHTGPIKLNLEYTIVNYFITILDKKMSLQVQFQPLQGQLFG